MTIQEVTNRAIQRWESEKRIPLPEVELISADRMETPPTGERVADRWNINHGGIAG